MRWRRPLALLGQETLRNFIPEVLHKGYRVTFCATERNKELRIISNQPSSANNRR